MRAHPYPSDDWLFDGLPEAPAADPNADQDPERVRRRRLRRRDLGITETYPAGDFIFRQRVR